MGMLDQLKQYVQRLGGGSYRRRSEPPGDPRERPWAEERSEAVDEPPMSAPESEPPGDPRTSPFDR